MKVRAVDIARKLNLSKATVSLALNHKPGVSEQTRAAIFACMAELEAATTTARKKYSIQLINVISDLKSMRNAELDLWSEPYQYYDEEVKRLGYTLSLTYVHNQSSELNHVIQQANSDDVAGIILIATELRQEQFAPFKRIQKPMIITDADFGTEYPCVCIDNVSAIRDAVDLLVSKGYHNIRYLRNSDSIYNFEQRRAGFRAGLRKNRLDLTKDSFISIGNTVENVYQNALQYFSMNRLPDAFIMENYQVSIGVMRAFRHLNISVPRDVALIGVDEIPEYFTGETKLSTIRVEHAERAKATLLFLDQKIKGKIKSNFKIYSNCEFIPGNTLRF